MIIQGDLFNWPSHVQNQNEKGERANQWLFQMEDFIEQKLWLAHWHFSLINADHLEKEELLGQVITILFLIMLKRKDRLPGQALGMRRCQDATGGGFMPQGSSQSQLVSITTIVTNIYIIIIKIPSEMEVAPRYNCWNCWHCWQCSTLFDTVDMTYNE